MMTPRPNEQLELAERNVVSNASTLSPKQLHDAMESPYGSLNRRADFHLEDFI